MPGRMVMNRIRIFRSILSSIPSLVMIVALECVGTTIDALAAAQLNAPSNTNTVAVSNSRIDVSWHDNSANESGFEVHRSTNGPSGAFSLIGTTAAGVTSRADAGLNPSTQYCYEVRAFITVNSVTSYSGFANTACATTLPPPGLHITVVTSGVDLDADGYSSDVWQGS